MPRLRRAAGAAVIAWLWLPSLPVRAAAEDTEVALKRSCDRVKDVAFPAADQPDEAARMKLRGCHSEELLYGIGQEADPVKARACAYLERAAGDDEVFGGSAILMTIYARGVGAPQNLDLAIRLACELEGAPAEVEGRVAHLEGLRRAPGSSAKKKGTFDLCDDVTSGFMMGHCAAHEQRMKVAKRDRRFAARIAGWTAAEQAAFQRLRAAASEFFRARSANEIDQSGTARAALQIEEEERLETGFGALLDQVERGTLPSATAAELARVDREPNAAYQRVMKAAGPQWGTVSKEGIRQAERRWPKYRDAWAAFVKLKYPHVDPASIEVRLTRDRTGDLDEFAPATSSSK